MIERQNSYNINQFQKELAQIENEFGAANVVNDQQLVSRIRESMGDMSLSEKEIRRSAQDTSSLTVQAIENTGLFSQEVTSRFARAATILAVQVYSSSESVQDKKKRLAWISSFTNIEGFHLDEVSALSEKMRDSLFTPKERWQQLTETVSNWIEDRNKDFKDWWASPARMKLIQTGQFAIGAGVGFLAADTINKFDPTFVKNLHTGLAGARLATELLSHVASEAERKHPRIARLSRKIAGEKAVSGAVRNFGVVITKFQTHPTVLGFSVGVLGHGWAEEISGQENFIHVSEVSATESLDTIIIQTQEPELSPTHTKTPLAETGSLTQTPEPIHTPTQVPEPTSTPTERLTPTPEDLSIEPPMADTTDLPSHEDIFPSIDNGVITDTPTYEVVEHVITPNENITTVVENYGYYPYGEGMNYFIDQNLDFFTNSELRTQDQIDAFQRLYEFHISNPDITWQDIMNESVKGTDWATNIGKDFTKAFENIKPGTLFKLAKPLT